MRIDAHQHFWRYEPSQFDWIDDRMSVLRRDFLPGDLKTELDAAGFDACVAVQAPQTLEETRWLLSLADTHPFIVGVVGWVNLQSADVARELVEFSPHPKLVGVRHIVQSEPDDFMDRPAFRRGIAQLAPFDLAYDILIYHHQLAAACRLVAAFPDQQFVLDHVAKPAIKAGAVDEWRAGLRTLAAHPNVWCKLSGLVTEADWQTWTPAQMRPYLETALECFGADRLLIGSDWPVCTLAATYRTTMNLTLDFIQTCSAAEQDAICGLNAMKCWKIGEKSVEH